VGLIKPSKFNKAGAYFIELLIVVVGVSIAFQLSVWNDAHKSRETENHLLQNFIAENRLNRVDIDSTLANVLYNMEANPHLIELLKDPQPNMDSIRLNMSLLYSLVWPDITSTHLNSYLIFESGTSPLKEEMLALKSYYVSVGELTNIYVEQKQVKYFDYLSDAVDMTDGLRVYKKEKLFNVQFRNNLLVIYYYELSLINTLEKIIASQQKVEDLIEIQLHK